MTFNHSATTRRAPWSSPTRTPLCWTQPPPDRDRWSGWPGSL